MSRQSHLKNNKKARTVILAFFQTYKVQEKYFAGGCTLNASAKSSNS